MASVPLTHVGAAPQTPTQLLQAQVQLLEEIRQGQQVEIGQLRQQNQQLSSVLTAFSQQQAPTSAVTTVTIENFNMPFLAIVGFLIKLTLASIPAAIVLGIIWFVVILVLGSALGPFRYMF